MANICQSSAATGVLSEVKDDAKNEKSNDQPETSIIASEGTKRDHATYRGDAPLPAHHHQQQQQPHHPPHHPHHAHHHGHHYPYHYPPYPAAPSHSARPSAERRDSASSVTSNSNASKSVPHHPHPYGHHHPAAAHHHHHHAWWAAHHHHYAPHAPSYVAPPPTAASSAQPKSAQAEATTKVPAKVVDAHSKEKKTTSTSQPSNTPAEETKKTPLVPTERDICFSKGVGVHNNPHNGNYKYMQLIAANKGQYFRNLTKRQKTLLTRKIVDFVLTSGVRFLARDTSVGGKKGDWYDIGFARSIEETSSALRKKGDWAGLYEMDEDRNTSGSEESATAVSPSSSSDESTSSGTEQESQSSKFDELGSPKLIIPPHLQKFYRPSSSNATSTKAKATVTSASGKTATVSQAPRQHHSSAYAPHHGHHPYWPPPHHAHHNHHPSSAAHPQYRPHYHHHPAASVWHLAPPGQYYHPHAPLPYTQPKPTTGEKTAVSETKAEPSTVASAPTTTTAEPPAKRARTEQTAGASPKETVGEKDTAVEKPPLSSTKMARRVSDETVTMEQLSGTQTTQFSESAQKENTPNSMPNEIVAVNELENKSEKRSADSYDMGGLAALSAAAFLRLCDNAHSVVNSSDDAKDASFPSNKERTPQHQRTIIF